MTVINEPRVNLNPENRKLTNDIPGGYLTGTNTFDECALPSLQWLLNGGAVVEMSEHSLVDGFPDYIFNENSAPPSPTLTSDNSQEWASPHPMPARAGSFAGLSSSSTTHAQVNRVKGFTLAQQSRSSPELFSMVNNNKASNNKTGPNSKKNSNPSSATPNNSKTPFKQDPGQKPGCVPSHEKPPYSFPCLIGLALLNSETGQIAVSEIYKYILRHFPYYLTAKSGWKNSIRHNLSLNKFFVKIERAKDDTGKGSLWAITPNMSDGLIKDIRQCEARYPQRVKASRAKVDEHGNPLAPPQTAINASQHRNNGRKRPSNNDVSMSAQSPPGSPALPSGGQHSNVKLEDPCLSELKAFNFGNGKDDDQLLMPMSPEHVDSILLEIDGHMSPQHEVPDMHLGSVFDSYMPLGMDTLSDMIAANWGPGWGSAWDQPMQV